MAVFGAAQVSLSVSCLLMLTGIGPDERLFPEMWPRLHTSVTWKPSEMSAESFLFLMEEVLRQSGCHGAAFFAV